MNIIENLEKIVVAEAGVNNGRKSLDPDENLLAQGIVDSLGVIKLIVSLEEKFGIEIMEEDVVPENFQSLSCLARFVEQKQEKR